MLEPISLASARVEIEANNKMQSTKKSGQGRAALKKKTRPIVADTGVALLDSSLKVIAADQGAAAILNFVSTPSENGSPAFSLPNDVLEVLRGSFASERAPVKAHVQLGNSGYVCRAYLLTGSDQNNSEPIIAVCLERDLYADDAICEIVNKYHLTEREQDVLRGISLGLSTKELAGWMSISPNTVKAFIRLVMIKMGVTTRAGIVAKILHNGGSEQSRALLEAVPPAKKYAVSRFA